MQILFPIQLSFALINEKRTGLVNADMTLKSAKRTGKEYLIFNEDLKLAKQYEANINMANTVKNAITSDRVFPYFQPIVNVQTRKIKLYPLIIEIMIEKSFTYLKKKNLILRLISLLVILQMKKRDNSFLIKSKSMGWLLN